MNTATATRAAPPAPPKQLAFADAPAELPHLRIAAMGVLQFDAELRTCTDSRHELTVLLLQPGDDLPLVATWRDIDDSCRDAGVLAADLRRGSTVLVRGTGLRRVTYRGTWALALQRCETVSLIAFDGASSTLAR